MAKITYANALYNYSDIEAHYGVGGHFSATEKSSATWVDSQTNNQMLVEGRGLKFVEGELVKGTVTKITFEDFEGADFAVFRGEFDAKKFGHLGSHDMADVLSRLCSGDDRITGTDNGDYIMGKNGNDIIKGGNGHDGIIGGRGNDRMWGGEGADVFVFESFEGNKNHDTVYGFDPNGGGMNQDYISSEADVHRIHGDGNNTIIEFEDGGSLTLIDVKRLDISTVDFNAPI